MKKLIVLFLTLVVLTGCGKKVKKENEREESKIKEVQVVDVNSKIRPVAVMINNVKVAQPYQTGLNEAYLIYEIIVEGGITRLMAVYQDVDDIQIGTIRSSRHYFLDYALENEAIYVHFGYSEEAKNDISRLNIDNINGLVDDFYWRDKSLPVSSEHTVYTTMSRIKNMAKGKGYRDVTDKHLLFNYEADPIDLSIMEGAIKADDVIIKYSNAQTSEFVYDAINNNYIRKSNGEVRQDYITKDNFTAKNIITYKVDNYSIDSYGRQDINNIGMGEGYYISNGYAVPIKWVKDSEGSRTIYKYLDGKEVILNDGNTYIEIQPSKENIEIITNEVS